MITNGTNLSILSRTYAKIIAIKRRSELKKTPRFWSILQIIIKIPISYFLILNFVITSLPSTMFHSINSQLSDDKSFNDIL